MIESRSIPMALCAALSLVPSTLAGSPGVAFFTPLGHNEGSPPESRATAISADGTTVVGTTRNGSTLVGFVWTTADGLRPLAELDETLSGEIPTDVSADGTFILTGSLRWSSMGGAIPLIDPTGEINLVQAVGMSADGHAITGIGWLAKAGGTVTFRWTEATGVVSAGALQNDLGFSDAAGISISDDGGVFAGQSMSTGFSVEPVRWTAMTGLTGLGDVPGGEFYAIAWGISGDGSTLVGDARMTQPAGDEAFLWRADTGFVLLDPLHGTGLQLRSSAQAASRDGSVIVGYDERVGGAALFDPIHGVRSVAAVLQTEFHIDLDGWELLIVTDISADGTRLIGNGRNPQGDLEAWIANIPRTGPAIPAASPLGLAAIGLGIVAAAQFIIRARSSR